MKKAREYDGEHNEPDCELDEKASEYSGWLKNSTSTWTLARWRAWRNLPPILTQPNSEDNLIHVVAQLHKHALHFGGQSRKAEHALSAAYDLLTKDDVLTAIAEIGECG